MLTHVDRTFVNKNVSRDTVNRELQASRDEWINWFMVNKSFNTKVANKTFAQVLSTKLLDKTQERVSKQSFKRNGQSQVLSNPCHRDSQCVPSKCIRVKRKVKVVHKIDNSSSNAGTGKLRLNTNTQEYCWPVSNKFQLLRNKEDDNDDNGQSHHGATHDTFTNKLEGNKNKTGLTLGKSCELKNGVVHATSVQSNTNKMGQRLCQITQTNCTKTTANCHEAKFKFRGNKNGIRAKLGTEPRNAKVT